MPTGYTAVLHDGDQSFADFALRCARGIGYLGGMRDEPMDAPIPDEFRPQPYLRESLERAKLRLAEVESWDEAEAERRAAGLNAERAAWIAEANKTSGARRERFEAMRDRVMAWRLPSADFLPLRDLMLSQIDEGLRRECGTPVHDMAPETGPVLKAAMLQDARRDVERSLARVAEDEKNARTATEWVRALKASVAG